MNLTSHTRSSVLHASMLVLALAMVSAGAQGASTLTGTYVLTEEGLTPAGQSLVTLASLTFSDTGTITGTAIMQVGASQATFDAQGTYSIAADGTGTMALSTSVTTSDGDTAFTTANYKLIQRSSGALSLLRVDGWYQTSGELALASTSALKGTYYLTESAGRAGTRIAEVEFDGSGNVNGYEIVGSFGSVSRVTLSGTTEALTNGFRTLSLTTAKTDSDTGETQITKETYAFLVTRENVRMLRTDAPGSALLIMSN